EVQRPAHNRTWPGALPGRPATFAACSICARHYIGGGMLRQGERNPYTSPGNVEASHVCDRAGSRSMFLVIDTLPTGSPYVRAALAKSCSREETASGAAGRTTSIVARLSIRGAVT